MEKELKTRCELALMGRTVEVSRGELKDVIPYVASAMSIEVDTDEVIKEMFKYTEALPRHMVFNQVCGMRCLTVSLESADEDYNLLSEDGAFCSVYNFDAPNCSELGYSFFKKKNDGFVHRIA